MIETSRRGFLLGLGAVLAAPAIVKIEHIMPVRNRLIVPELTRDGWVAYTMAPQDWAAREPEERASMGVERQVWTYRQDRRPWALRWAGDHA